jgi:hypothetical protein
MICSAWLNAQQITISLDTVSANAGDSLVIPLNTTNFVNCGSFTLFIQYNPGVLHWGRALNWNNELIDGIYMANSSYGLLALVWTDIGGASIPAGKIADLKFKYVGGSSGLNFTANCEITDIWGLPVSPTPVFSNGFALQKLKAFAHASKIALCLGDSSTLSATTTGGFGTPSISWSSVPAGLNSGADTVVVHPLLTTSYFASAFDGNDTSVASVEITVYQNTPPLPVTNMFPANGSSGVSLPFLLSWSPSGNTTSYDVKIWKVGEPEPATPMFAGITQISQQVSTGLDYGFTYQWKVVSNNPCLQTSGPIQTFTIRNLPDLTVSNVIAPATAFSGQNIVASFRISNTGPGGTLSTLWHDRLYLSTDNTLETDLDYYVGDYANFTSLNPGESYVQNVSFSLPQGISGYFYLIAIADIGNTVQETNNNNNTGFNDQNFLITLSPTPDLQVTKITLPNSIFSGQTMNASWKVKNMGTAPTATSQWYDRVYLSSDTSLNTSSAYILGTFIHNGTLGIDSAYSVVMPVNIPNYILGRYFVYVLTDFYNAVYEHALENNNKLKSDSLTVYLTPPPDLEVAGIVVPASASKSEVIPVTYTVTNVGGNPASGWWRDQIYISNSINLNTSTASLIGESYRIYLAQDESYTTTFNVTIPNHLTGPYYIFVFTDAKNNVFEFTAEDNNIGRSQNAIQIVAPDPQITSIANQPGGNSGALIHLHYFNRNNGPGKLIGSWTDKIYISKSTVFNPDSAFLIRTLPFPASVMPSGDSIEVHDSAYLPNGVAGDYYLYVVTDYFNTILENAGETNNISRSGLSFLINLTPWPDLVVDNIVYATDTIKSGLHMGLSFRVSNNGPGVTAVPDWEDLVYISLNPFSPVGLISIDVVAHHGILASGANYNVSANILIPKYLPEGFYYIWIKTDGYDKVYEYTANNNNFTRGNPIYILPYPPGDLVCTGFSLPDTVSSGQVVTVSWSGANQSIVPSASYCWYDQTYFSTDTIFNPSNDILFNDYLYCGGLPVSGNYSKDRAATIPNGLHGDYFVFQVIDRSNSNGDADFQNNIRMKRNLYGQPAAVHILLTPPPDLQAVLFTAPAVVLSGQPFQVKWTVTNTGVGPTASNVWLDNVLLSSDINNSAGDVVLAAKNHNGVLPAGVSYTDSAEVYVAASVSGNFYLLFNTDYNDVVFENFSESNNKIPITVQVQQPPPADLLAVNIIPPGNIMIGGSNNFEVSYKIRNQGDNPASGMMKDIIYLSSDTVWDVNDYVAGSVAGIISIGPGAETNRSLTTTVSSLSVGNYYVIIRTDVLNNVFESNDTNNTTYADQACHVDVPELPLDVWVEAPMSNFTPLYYRIEISSDLAGEVLRVILKGDSVYGNNELYLRYGNSPTRNIFDFSYSNANYGNQEILIPFLQAGTYYLMAYGSSSGAVPQLLRLFAEKLEFSILSVDRKEGGNTGKMTVKILGSKFTSNMKLFLARDGKIIEGDSLEFVDQSKVFVTFDLNLADTGYYSVYADRFCEGKAVLMNGFHVIPGLAPNLVINTIAPTAARPQGVVAVVVEFTNAGNTDLYAPDILFRSLANAPVALTVAGLAAANTTVLLQLREPGGPTDILRPGMSGTITVYTKASQALSFVINLPNY